MRISILIPLALTAFSLGAQERKGPAPGAFIRSNMILSTLDTDGNFAISAEEIAAAPKVLLKLDKDKNGELSVEELTPPVPGDMSADDMVKSLLAFDKNGDGKLTKNELPERMLGLFERADLNKNGVLDQEELNKVAMAMKFPAGRPEDPPPPGAAPKGPPRVDRVLASIDTDGDKKLSAAEIAAAPAGLKTLDKDGDGQISEDEVRPTPPARKPGEGPNH